jgi:hypothetical protein
MRNKNRHRRRPEVEALEALVPLSGASAGMHGAAVAVQDVSTRLTLPFATPIVLQGTVRGAFVVTRGNPDTGATYQVVTAGRITPLGQTAGTARVQTTGFILLGTATGTMTINAPRGSLRLNLTGPLQPGFSQPPSTVSFTITGGTRSFRNVVGTGTIDVALNSSIASGRSGTITLTFHGVPTPVA